MGRYGIYTLSLSDVPYPGCVVLTASSHMVTGTYKYWLLDLFSCKIGISPFKITPNMRRGYNFFSCSTQHEIFPAHKCYEQEKNSMLIFYTYEHLKFHAQLS